MKHFQDTETGKIYAFDDGYDPVTANNRNIPSTLTEAIKPKPDDSHVWYQGNWIKQEDTPPSYTKPISSVPSYNPAWMTNLRPYTAVHRDTCSGLKVTLDQVNANSYDGNKLAEVVAKLPLGNRSEIPALISYDGAIAIPQCEDCKRPVSDKPCYHDRVWEAPVGGGLSIVTGLASGSNSSNLEFGQVGNFSRVSLSHA